MKVIPGYKNYNDYLYKQIGTINHTYVVHFFFLEVLNLGTEYNEPPSTFSRIVQTSNFRVWELSFIFKIHFIHVILFFTLQLEIWSNLSNFSLVASASTDTATPNYCHASTHSAWNHAWKDWWTTYADRYVSTTKWTKNECVRNVCQKYKGRQRWRQPP